MSDRYGYIAIEALLNFCENSKDHAITPNDFMRMARVRVPERKTGRWIYGEDEYGIDGYHCDKCGFFVPWDYAHKFINYIDDYKFCPNCGIDMGKGGSCTARTNDQQAMD